MASCTGCSVPAPTPSTVTTVSSWTAAKRHETAVDRLVEGAAAPVGPAHRDGTGAALALGAAFLGAGQAARPQPLQEGDAAAGRACLHGPSIQREGDRHGQVYRRPERYNRARNDTRPEQPADGTARWRRARYGAVQRRAHRGGGARTPRHGGRRRRRRPRRLARARRQPRPRQRSGPHDWEGFETATRAAAAGGVTAVVDMPLNSSPVTTTTAALDAKLAAGTNRCFVDVGLLGRRRARQRRRSDRPGPRRRPRRQGLPGALRHRRVPATSASASCARRCRCCAITACRSWRTPSSIWARRPPADPRTYAGYLASRPRDWEDAAIALLIDLCRETRCPVHIVHLASASAIEAHPAGA